MPEDLPQAVSNLAVVLAASTNWGNSETGINSSTREASSGRLVWTGLDRTGHDRTGQDKFRTSQDILILSDLHDYIT